MKKICTDKNSILTAFAESRIGGRSENQDSYGWQETAMGYLVTVCDGMGGGPGGKTASTIAVNEIIAGVLEAEPDEKISNVIIKAVLRANMAIIKAGNDNPKLKGMGSTATVLLVNKNSAYVAHVGDSRIYQLRGRSKIFRTFDHSMVFEMVAQGIITEEQARLSAESNVITRALGIKPDLEVDIQELAYEKGDRFLLCTDGIHGMLPDAEIVKMITTRKTALGVVADNLAVTVDDLGRMTGGGHDNLTLAVIETNINSKLKTKMSKKVKYIIMGLMALFVISASLNIIQCSSASSVADDTTKVKELRDSIKVAQEENNKLSAEKKNLEKANSEQKALIDTVKKMAENGNAQSAVEIKKYLSDKK